MIGEGSAECSSLDDKDRRGGLELDVRLLASATLVQEWVHAPPSIRPFLIGIRFRLCTQSI